MDLVKVSKQRLQVMRDDGWASLLAEVSLFYTSHDISILDMEAIFVVSGRPRHNTQQNTNLHHYRIELFYTVIDMQLQELNNHFFEANTNLLLCMACLDAVVLTFGGSVVGSLPIACLLKSRFRAQVMP